MRDNKLRTIIDARLGTLQGTPESKKRIMKHIREENGRRRSLRLVPVLAISAMLTLTTIAFAVSTNLFSFFANRYEREEKNAPFEKAAENAVLSAEEPVSIGETGWVEIDSTFFDGERLMVAYRLKDTANITETWQPQKDELDQMSQMPSGMLPMFEERNDSVQAFYRSYEAGTPYGLHAVVTDRRDHAHTEDGIDLMVTDSGAKSEDGAMLNYMLFEELPEQVQKREAVHMVLRFAQTEAWYWFDGERLWMSAQSSEGDGIPVTLTAVKTR